MNFGKSKRRARARIPTEKRTRLRHLSLGVTVLMMLASSPVYAVEFRYAPLLDEQCSMLDSGDPSGADPVIYGVFDVNTITMKVTYYVRIVAPDPPGGDVTIDNAAVYANAAGYPTCSTASADLIHTICTGSCPNPLKGTFTILPDELDDLGNGTVTFNADTTHQGAGGEAWAGLAKDPPSHYRMAMHTSCTEDPGNPDPDVGGYMTLNSATWEVEYDIDFDPTTSPGSFTGRTRVDVGYATCNAEESHVAADLCGTVGTSDCENPMHGTYTLTSIEDRDAMIDGRHAIIFENGTAETWISVLRVINPDPGPGETPTVSGWGMIVMALLLVSAATCVIRRRQEPDTGTS